MCPPRCASRSFCFKSACASRSCASDCATIARREASIAFNSLCSRTARTSPFLTFDPSSTYIRSTRPGTFAPIIAWCLDLR